MFFHVWITLSVLFEKAEKTTKQNDIQSDITVYFCRLNNLAALSAWKLSSHAIGLSRSSGISKIGSVDKYLERYYFGIKTYHRY